MQLKDKIAFVLAILSRNLSVGGKVMNNFKIGAIGRGAPIITIVTVGNIIFKTIGPVGVAV